MSFVLMSQRVVEENRYQERRDVLDQRWSLFMQACGLIPIPVPNSGALPTEQLQSLPVSGVILTGGNDLVNYGGDAPERDAREHEMLDWAIRMNWPVLGVCRGMQSMVCYSGGCLEPVDKHVATEHQILWQGQSRLVNSYHRWQCILPANNWETLACSGDGVIEAAHHTQHCWLGIMWHPERNETFAADDIELFKKHFRVSNI